jgi:hypothetical protein
MRIILGISEGTIASKAVKALADVILERAVTYTNSRKPKSTVATTGAPP